MIAGAAGSTWPTGSTITSPAYSSPHLKHPGKSAMQINGQTVYSVSNLNVYIRQMFDMDWRMQDIWVDGEISNISQPASGHWYFTLKDDRSQLKAVMWKGSVATQRYIPRHGEKIRAHGKIGVYEAGGQYQLYADALVPLSAV